MHVKSLERCFNGTIDREGGITVDTVKDRFLNAILTSIAKSNTLKIELGNKSRKASSGQGVTSVEASSDRGEHIKFTTIFENVSDRSNTQHVFKTNDGSRNNIPDEVSELSVPGTRFDRQPHTHHVVTGETTQTNQIPEFFTGRFLTPCDPPSHQHQNLSKQVSQDINLPMVEQTSRTQYSKLCNSINLLAAAVVGLATL